MPLGVREVLEETGPNQRVDSEGNTHASGVHALAMELFTKPKT